MKVGTALGALSSVSWIVGTAASHDHAADEQPVLGQRPTRRPNFIFILTDDQDRNLASTNYMPLTLGHLQLKGTEFMSHYVTTALCCPSRVSLWTGKQPHNTNVTDVSPPWGKSESLVDYCCTVCKFFSNLVSVVRMYI